MALSIKGRRRPLLLSACGIAAFGGVALAQQATFSGQAEVGRALYSTNCAQCHGAALEGQSAGPLSGDAFLGTWGAGAANAGDLYR